MTFAVGENILIPAGTPVRDKYNNMRTSSRASIGVIHSIRDAAPLFMVFGIDCHDKIVSWSGGNCATAMSLIRKTPRVSICKKPSKRQLMVRRSVWKSIRDFDVTFESGYVLPKKFDKSIKSATIKKGALITISGKIFAHNNVLFVPTCIENNDVTFYDFDNAFFDKRFPSAGKNTNVPIPIKILSANTQLEVKCDQFVYVIRDSATGLYVKTHKQSETDPAVTRTSYNMIANPVLAQKYKTLAGVKSAILTHIGYYDDMYGIPYEIDFLNTYEIIKFEKFDMREVETIEIQSWHKHIVALRSITTRFSPEVRDLYHKIEKDSQLDIWKYIICFSEPVQKDSNVYKFLENYAPQSYRKQNTLNFVAMATIDFGVAFGIKSSSEIDCEIIEINTLRKMVEDAEFKN